MLRFCATDLEMADLLISTRSQLHVISIFAGRAMHDFIEAASG
jgi:hypothetical protein